MQDDDEFCNEVPFALSEIRSMAAALRDLASTLFLSKDIESNFSRSCGEDIAATRHLLNAVTDLLRRLFTRDSRRNFCQPDHWVPPEVLAERHAIVHAVIDSSDVQHSRWLRLLKRVPFAVPFETRVRIFHEKVQADRRDHQAADGRGRWLRIRRNFLFEDAMERMEPLGADIKDRLRVQFVDIHGIEEAGIDGGGLFSE